MSLFLRYFHKCSIFVKEILAEELPYFRYKRDHETLNAIINKELPVKPIIMTSGVEELWDVCGACWIHTPEKRASIHEVNSKLSQIITPVSERAQVRSNEMQSCKAKGYVSSER